MNFILFLQRLVPGPYTYDDKVNIFLTEFKPINTDLITSDAHFITPTTEWPSMVFLSVYDISLLFQFLDLIMHCLKHSM